MRGRWLFFVIVVVSTSARNSYPAARMPHRHALVSPRGRGGREPCHGLQGGHAIEKNSLALVGNARKIPPGRRRSTSWSSRLGSRARLIDRSRQ
jgi:hypothetical protein